MLVTAGRRRAFHDGCGLASCGRWEPEMRLCRAGLFTGRLRQRLAATLAKFWDHKTLAIQLAFGRHEVSPFSADLLAEARK
eukprot:8759498-Karenia_brevis.AAC.1